MKKLKNLHIRLTPEQHQGIVNAAKELGIAPTTWARMKLLMAVEASAARRLAGRCRRDIRDREER